MDNKGALESEGSISIKSKERERKIEALVPLCLEWFGRGRVWV
jgi:hypothetical protein